MKWANQPCSGANRSAVVTALESLDLVSKKHDFIAWTKAEFQHVIPHGAFAACVGKVLDFGVKPLDLVTADFPDSCLKDAYISQGWYHTFMMQRWLKSGEPQLFDLSLNAAVLNLGCLKAFTASGLQNIAAHGLFDIHRDHMTFFSFHKLPSPPGDEHGKLLRLMVPAMHAALLRCIRPHTEPQASASTAQVLTNRENEVLGWICQGKTNSEIASILQISPNTVKHQAQAILVKLKVNTRAQAATVAMHERLVSYK